MAYICSEAISRPRAWSCGIRSRWILPITSSRSLIPASKVLDTTALQALLVLEGRPRSATMGCSMACSASVTPRASMITDRMESSCCWLSLLTNDVCWERLSRYSNRPTDLSVWLSRSTIRCGISRSSRIIRRELSRALALTSTNCTPAALKPMTLMGSITDDGHSNAGNMRSSTQARKFAETI